jgi:phosphoribosylformylglycinamidine (FGAM) synthase-like enzyme
MRSRRAFKRVGEHREKTGVVVNLKSVLYKRAEAVGDMDFRAQERMVFAVPSQNKKKILDLFKKES